MEMKGTVLPHDERFAELAAIAALGALAGEDRGIFERHLAAGCPECEETLRAGKVDLALFALSSAPARPSDLLRQRLLKAAAREPAAVQRRRGASAQAIAVAAIVLLAATIGDDSHQRRVVRQSAEEKARLAAELTQSREELERAKLQMEVFHDPGLMTVSLAPMPQQQPANGKLFYSPKMGRAVLIATNLSPLPAGKQYELWCIADGKPVAAGVFDAAHGTPTFFESTAMPPGWGPIEKFAVTVEPAGGMPRPTGQMVLLGSA